MKRLTSTARSLFILVLILSVPFSGFSRRTYQNRNIHPGYGGSERSDGIEERLQRAGEGALLLDAGDNVAALLFFERFVMEDPCRIEIAEGLVEAELRSCRSDSAIAFLEDCAEGQTEPHCDMLQLYTGALKHHIARDFAAAGDAYGEAALLALGAGDTLSAAVLRRREAQSFLGARNPDAAFRAVTDAGKCIELLSARVVGRADKPDDRTPVLQKALHFLLRMDAELAAFRAEAQNLTDDLVAADSLYREALGRAEKGGHRQVRSYCLNGLGRIREKQQRIGEAAELYRGALVEERVLGTVERTAAILNNLGQAETRMGNLATAKEHLEESRELAVSCRSGWLLGYVFYGLGAIAEAEGERQEALDLFTESLERHTDGGNRWGALGARLRLGYNLTMLGDYSKAIDHYERCRVVYEEMGSLYGLSWTLGGLALANHNLGNFSEAERFYRQAYEVREKLGDRKGVAWCLNSIGMVYDLQGRYREALAHEHRAMAIYEELGDSVGVGAVHFSIGSVYFYLGNYTESMKHYERAFSIATDRNERDLLFRVTSGMGSVYLAAGRPDLAEAFYRRTLDVLSGTQDRSDLIWATNNLASVYIQRGESARARAMLEGSIGLLADKGEAHIQARSLYLYGNTDISIDEALASTGDALAIADENGLQELVWKSLVRLAELYYRRGDYGEAASMLERAIVSVESLRRSVGLDELQRHMLRPAIVPYELMVSLILETGEDRGAVRRAFTYTERARAQILAALMREALHRIERGGAGELVGEERDLIAKLTFLQGRLQDGSISGEKRRELLDQVTALEREFVGVRVRKAAHNEANTAALYPAGDELDGLVASLRESERMLSYFLGREGSYLFSVRGGIFSIHPLPPRKEIEERVGRFLQLLRQTHEEAVETGKRLSRPSYSLPAGVLHAAERELYELLLGPVEGDLDGETLVIVPDGLLNRLPFSLLRSDEGYLVERHRIYYTPSLRSLSYLRRRFASRSEGGKHLDYDIIALGAEGAGNTGTLKRKRVYPFTDIPIEPLPHASEEARSVARLFPSSFILTGTGAGERSFKESPIGNAEIIHIASHIYVDNEDVRRSFIVLNPESEFGILPGRSGDDARMRREERATRDGSVDMVEIATEDGLFQWHEVAGLRLNASLVVLSGCKSAGGVLAYGEGITGLTQAFLYAGAHGVLATQMDVPDRYTGRFMLSFYRRLREGNAAASALRDTQLEALGWRDSGRTAFWATFVLVGDGNIIYDSQELD